MTHLEIEMYSFKDLETMSLDELIRARDHEHQVRFSEDQINLWIGRRTVRKYEHVRPEDFYEYKKKVSKIETAYIEYLRVVDEEQYRKHGDDLPF
jgi:hypothetical protein